MTKECKITITPIEKEERMVSIPARVYYHTCIGILFTPCSIPITKKEARLEDAVARSETADHAVVMKRRKDNPHSNVIVPLEYVPRSYVGCDVLTYLQNVQRCQEGTDVHQPRRDQRFSERPAQSDGG